MSPEAAVTLLAELVNKHPNLSEDQVHALMTSAGVPHAVADRAFKFTQTAWGRASLDGMGVPFGADYLCFNAVGEVIESGLLADSPYYQTALRLAPKYAGTPGFESLALTSADVHVVNETLRSGKDPKEMAMGPAGYFMEPPVPAGKHRAVQLLIERAKKSNETPSESTPPKKTWWRFW